VGGPGKAREAMAFALIFSLVLSFVSRQKKEHAAHAGM
jgi:hypothetical protein